MAARLTAVAVALIVGVTLVAGLIVGAQRDDDTGPIDLLIYNGRVYTGNAAEPFAEAVAIRGNRIYRVGSNREIKRLRRRATTVIDAHGGSVLPGFSDAHARLPVVDEAAETVAPAPAAASSTAVAKPAAAAPAPAASASAAPLAAANATRPAAKTNVSAGVREAIEGAHRLGVVGLNTVADGAELAAYETLRRDEQLPLRVVAALRVDAPIDPATLDRLDAMRTAHADDPVFRVDAAALRVMVPAPAARPSGRRTHTAPATPPALSPEAAQALTALDQHGWNVVLQVEDERGLAAALEALSGLPAPTPAGRERRHRIELTRPMPLDVARIKSLGIAVSLPLPAGWAPGRTLVADASPETAPKTDAEPTDVATPAADSHSGLRLLMASEGLADPRLGLQALLAGPETSDGAPLSAEPVAESALAAAIDAYTSTAAWATNDERRRGAIARDMFADIVILSADLFTLSADKLLDAVVTITIFDGKVVYDREAEGTHSTDQ